VDTGTPGAVCDGCHGRTLVMKVTLSVIVAIIAASWICIGAYLAWGVG
jgi:hypothetical protein